MNDTDIFVPSSYNNGQASFLSYFGPEDQLFQRPLLNTLQQNYVPNPRPPPPQRDISFDQSQTRFSPPQRPVYAPPVLPRQQIHEQPPLPSSNPFIEYQRAPPQQQQRYEEHIPRQVNPPNNNQEMFFTDHPDDQQQSTRRSGEQPQDQDSKRQGRVLSLSLVHYFLSIF